MFLFVLVLLGFETLLEPLKAFQILRTHLENRRTSLTEALGLKDVKKRTLAQRHKAFLLLKSTPNNGRKQVLGAKKDKEINGNQVQKPFSELYNSIS